MNWTQVTSPSCPGRVCETPWSLGSCDKSYDIFIVWSERKNIPMYPIEPLISKNQMQPMIWGIHPQHDYTYWWMQICTWPTPWSSLLDRCTVDRQFTEETEYRARVQPTSIDHLNWNSYDNPRNGSRRPSSLKDNISRHTQRSGSIDIKDPQSSRVSRLETIGFIFRTKAG